MRRNKISVWFVIIPLIYLTIHATPAKSKECEILVVMSYEKENPWCEEILIGIDSILADRCGIHYFYMDTKKNMKGGPEMAQKAYNLYQQLQPSGIIAADDNAQTMFVLPYLKEKEEVPIVFSAVNAEASAYGYPAKNITGILERNFISQSIALAKQIVPSIGTVGFLAKESPSGRAIQKQVNDEAHAYVAKLTEFKLVRTEKELLEAVKVFRRTSDLLFVGATSGILDKAGKPLDNRQVTQLVTEVFGKPTIGANDFHVKYGVLCAVVKSGIAQGQNAAEMLIQMLEGTPAIDIPVRTNQYGVRMINVDVMQSLNIHPSRRALLGADLVRIAE